MIGPIIYYTGTWCAGLPRVDTSPAPVTPAAALPAVPRARARTEESGQARRRLEAPRAGGWGAWRGQREARGGLSRRQARATWLGENEVRGYEPRCRRCRVSVLACVPVCRVLACVLANNAI